MQNHFALNHFLGQGTEMVNFLAGVGVGFLVATLCFMLPASWEGSDGARYAITRVAPPPS